MSVAVAVDTVLLTLHPGVDPGAADSELRFVSVRRGQPPHRGAWSLPGRIIADDEDLDTAAVAALASQTGLSHMRHVEQLGTFGAPARDPRGRVVSVTYLGLLPEPVEPSFGARWLSPGAVGGDLAFDHERILAAGLSRLRSKLGYSNVAYGLLPDEFTLGDLQAVYEAVLETELDKRNFRKKVLGLDLVTETGHVRRGPHRPAQLYRFTSAELVTIAAAAIA